VHLTLIFVVFILLATSQVRPFGGLKHGVLHMLEMASLMVSNLLVSSFFFLSFFFFSQHLLCILPFATLIRQLF